MSDNTSHVEGFIAELIAQGEGQAKIAFEHSFFSSVKDSHFRVSDQTREAVFVVKLSDNDVMLPLPGIKREFSLADDSRDAMMLDLVEHSLRFVKLLRIGDPIPKELLTGEASWEVTEVHKQIAYQRLTLQLVTWMSGDEITVTNPEELMQVADDPKTKEKVDKAFAEAAEKLEFGPDGKEKVVELLEQLADEFAYIEALRDMYHLVVKIDEKVKGLKKRYTGELSIFEIANSVARLMAVAVEEFGTLFDQVDAQTGEIMSVLKNIDAQTKFVQALRDDLHRRLMAWDEMFGLWQPVTVVRSRGNEDLLRATYRFLAPRFMKADEWVLMNQIKEAPKKRKTEMVW